MHVYIHSAFITVQLTCGPLNRRGFLCGECSDGFGPLMILQRYNCSEAWHTMTLVVPTTAYLFYRFVLIFCVSVT